MNEQLQTTNAASARTVRLVTPNIVAPGDNGVLTVVVATGGVVEKVSVDDACVQILEAHAGGRSVKRDPSDEADEVAAAILGALVPRGALSAITFIAKNISSEPRALEVEIAIAPLPASESIVGVARQRPHRDNVRPRPAQGRAVTGPARTGPLSAAPGPRMAPGPRGVSNRSGRSGEGDVVERHATHVVHAPRLVDGPRTPDELKLLYAEQAKTKASQGNGPHRSSAQRRAHRTYGAPPPIRQPGVMSAVRKLGPQQRTSAIAKVVRTEEVVGEENERVVALLAGHAEGLLRTLRFGAPVHKAFKPSVSAALTRAMTSADTVRAGRGIAAVRLSPEAVQALYQVVHHAGVRPHPDLHDECVRAIADALAHLRRLSTVVEMEEVRAVG